LGAIVIEALIFGLMDVQALKRIYRISRTKLWVGIIALLGVLTFGTLQGVLIGLLLPLYLPPTGTSPRKKQRKLAGWRIMNLKKHMIDLKNFLEER
jgi:MFS superfamily sulfate permease-like transporter